MRSQVVALVLLAGAAAACGEAGAAGKPGGSDKYAEQMGDIPFVIGQTEGARVVKATNRPPMYFFTAAGSPGCKAFAREAFTDKKTVERVNREFTPVLVDGDDPANAGFAAKHGLYSPPSIVFATKDGDSVFKLDGASAPAFIHWVANIADE